MITCKSSTSTFGTHALQRTVKTSPRFVGLFGFQRNPSSSQRNRKCTLASSSFGRPQWARSRKNLVNTNDTNSNADDVSGDEKVHCEVEVISWRERRIKAEISVNADIESVWNALTDYERLADFIPNLVCSGRIPCPHPGRIWLEQRGLQRALYWHIEARVVLDLQEFPNSANDRKLHFSMVDGDFKKFEGKWSLNSGTSGSMWRSGGTTKRQVILYEGNNIKSYRNAENGTSYSEDPNNRSFNSKHNK